MPLVLSVAQDICAPLSLHRPLWAEVGQHGETLAQIDCVAGLVSPGLSNAKQPRTPSEMFVVQVAVVRC